MAVGTFEQWLTQCKKIVYEGGASKEVYDSYFQSEYNDYWIEKYMDALSPEDAVQVAREDAMDSADDY